ncbi:MAG: hypothetical protein IJ416_03225 [Ruminiclostridium sp.]|nr:hypothetical protein [Ruminiclostridium sp.]
MFLTDTEFLWLLGEFLVTGVITAVFLDIIRILRIIAGAGKTAVFISDMLMTIIFAVVVMFTAIENGYGKLRIYYFAAAALGLLLYFFTIGMITRFIASFAGKFLRRAVKYVSGLICKPVFALFGSIKQKNVYFFVQLRQKISKRAENLQFGLKKHPPMMYNNKIGKLYLKGGEERNVIKAKVRKKA